MSGNGNGNQPTINRPSANESCEELVINTNLSSPNADVIRNLNHGDILLIQAASDQGPVQAINDSGEIAGSIMTREYVRLLQCIVAGNQYIAEVISVNGAQCDIQVRIS